MPYLQSMANPRSTVTTRLMTLLQHPKMRTMTTPAQLKARLVAMGLGETCGRCMGSGRYGPNCVDGGRCFGCRGRKSVAPRLTKALEARAIAAVESGEFESYVQARVAAAKARRLAKTIWDDAITLYAATAWCQYFYKSAEKQADLPDGGWLRHGVSNNYDEVYERGATLAARMRVGYGTDADAVELIAIKAEYLQALADMDTVHAIALDRGLYDVSYAEFLAVRALPSHLSHAAENALCVRDATLARRLLAEVRGTEAAA